MSDLGYALRSMWRAMKRWDRWSLVITFVGLLASITSTFTPRPINYWLLGFATLTLIEGIIWLIVKRHYIKGR